MGIADSIDTTGDNAITSAAKELIYAAAGHIDTTNRIIEETTAVKEAIEESDK